jgi:hypothetical protein
VSIPAERIHLHMEGLPQDLSESAAMLIHNALSFCSQPETFPVFQAFAVANSQDYDWAAEAMKAVTRDILIETAFLVAAGVLVDLGGEL